MAGAGAMSQNDDGHYSQLKRRLLASADSLTVADLDSAVYDYRCEINSKRRSSYITTLGDLIAVLEKRGMVSEHDYSLLQRLVQRLPTNVTAAEQTTAQPSVTCNVSGARQAIPSAVLQRVSEEIGGKWREMARKLKLREGEINRIQAQYLNDNRKCAEQCLLLHQSKSENPHQFKLNLLSALEKARRTDLRNLVQKIWEQSNF